MRNIFIVNATQVVTSDSHPKGLFSTANGNIDLVYWTH